MKPAAYDRFTQALHWSAALLVIGVYAIAVSREFVPKGDFRSWLLSLHMSGGMLIMALTFVRLGWRSVSPAPPMTSAKPARRKGVPYGRGRSLSNWCGRQCSKATRPGKGLYDSV